ncbi:UDP-glucosyltransferase 2-like [Bactrocera neohumeralis]|uniref:UDP-glucosyltransferase 2-like n=1 Tax=Bactrocera neohumeralis TaxID=98809 RepID=UPI002166B0F4|nr:UDP-glucosyltransferase 2-like [Bactrocera neohumeralis]XP_050316493.1 UDP-glucosyltransferase 2-like [Bactrocera neohumeralis]
MLTQVFIKLLLSAYISLIALQQTNAANILAIFPFPGPSQYICVQAYLKALAARGHEVTVISAFPQKKPLQNFRDISLAEILDGYEETIVDVITEERNKWQELNLYYDFFTGGTLSVLKSPKVQELLHSNEHFDLIIVEALQMDAIYALAHHYNALLIGVSTFGTDPTIDELVGNTSPISYVPLPLSQLSDRMNFWQRLQNLWHHLLHQMHMHLFYLPNQAAIYKQYFPNSTADIYAVRKNFSLVLLNQHFAISFPRPYVPNAIEVAGMHISQRAGKLPTDIENFIKDAKQGAIYFSLGSNVKSKNLSKDRLETIMRVFASLPYNILWKFEAIELPNKPPNVYINKWFAQSDVLAQPNVKLFISHAGLLSTTEAIHYAKPLVGMPVFFDQFLNMERIKRAGIGVFVDYKSFTYDELRSAIVEVMENPKYTQTIQQMSRRYHDQPMKPLDKAIFWTEYVLRHGGAPHMRVTAQELNFIQYHSLDTLLVLLGGVILVSLMPSWFVYRNVKRLLLGDHGKIKLKHN